MQTSFRQLERTGPRVRKPLADPSPGTCSTRRRTSTSAQSRGRVGSTYKTASEHLRRLAIAGLVLKKAKGTHVLHAISPRGELFSSS